MKINEYTKHIQYEFRDNIFIELDIRDGSYSTCIYCDWGQILLGHGYMSYSFKDLRIHNHGFGTSLSLKLDLIYGVKTPEYYHTLYYRTVFIDYSSNYKPLIFCID